jgi:hypothetical protein
MNNEKVYIGLSKKINFVKKSWKFVLKDSFPQDFILERNKEYVIIPKEDYVKLTNPTKKSTVYHNENVIEQLYEEFFEEFSKIFIKKIKEYHEVLSESNQEDEDEEDDEEDEDERISLEEFLALNAKQFALHWMNNTTKKEIRDRLAERENGEVYHKKCKM